MIWPRVPVLCYHRIEQPPAHAPRDTNFVTPEQFAEQVAMLASWGCTGVTVRDVARWQRGEMTLPPRAIALTFDDAYDSVVTAAIPTLAQHGWPCTVYAVSHQVGGSNVWDAAAPRATLLDAAALRTLAAAGHEIGSHSRHHRRITTLTEARLGSAVTSFAFPYGTHDRPSLRALSEAGYTSGGTLKRWANARGGNPLRMGRMGIGGPIPTWQVAAKLVKLRVTPSRA